MNYRDATRLKPSHSIPCCGPVHKGVPVSQLKNPLSSNELYQSNNIVSSSPSKE